MAGRLIRLSLFLDQNVKPVGARSAYSVAINSLFFWPQSLETVGKANPNVAMQAVTFIIKMTF